MRGTRVTIAQVAELAGVSTTTVSHVLSGKRYVSEANRQRVHQAVQELGYRPNNVARNLRTRRSQMVAVIIPDIANPYYTGLARGIADVVDSDGYGTYICNTDGLLEREQKFIQDVLDRGVDGVAMASVHVATDLVAQAVNLGTPFTCVGGSIDHPDVDLVTADDEEGSRAATSYLITRGAKRVAMIGGTAGSGGNRDGGYRRALSDAGLHVHDDLVISGDWTRRGGRAAMHELLKRSPRPDAVFCANDLMAIGAIDAVHEAGLSVPNDISLVGFDDVDAAALVTPALTTVSNPSYDAGWVAGELLLERVSGKAVDGRRTVRLPCRLIEREST